MVVNKILEGLNWHSYYREEEFRNTVLSYFKGDISFEEIEVTDNHSLYDSDASGLINRAIQIADELDDKSVIKRAIQYAINVVMSHYKKDLFKKLKIDLIIEYYPNFFDEVISKQEYIETVFKSYKLYYAAKFITKMKENTYLKDELFEFIKNSPILKTNGYYNSSKYNLLCFYKFDALKESHESKDHSKTMDLVLEYLDILTDDYNFKYYSDDNETWKGRTTLSKEGKKALLDIVRERKDFENNINILNKELKQKEGVRERKYFALLRDDSFELLFKYLKESHIEATYTNNLLDLANELNPEDRIKELYFKTCKDGCSFSDLDKVIEELEREEKGLSEKERDNLRTYVITYTIEHYNCKKVVHEKLAEELMKRYGADYITKYFKAKGRPDKLMGIEIFSRYTNDKKFQQLRLSLELELIDNLLAYIAVEGKFNDVKDYILGKTKKIDVKKSIIKKVDGDTVYKILTFIF